MNMHTRLRLSAALFLMAPLLPAQGLRGLDFFSTANQRFGGWRLVWADPDSDGAPPGDLEVSWARVRMLGFKDEKLAWKTFKNLGGGSGVIGPLVRWALLDPDGKVRASGKSDPDLGELSRILGWGNHFPFRENLDQLLRDHPGLGEARLAAAELALAQIPTRPVGPRAWVEQSRLTAEAREALAALLTIPDWPLQVDLAALEPTGLGQRLLLHRNSLGDIPGRMAEQSLAALAENPDSLRVQQNLAIILRLLSRDQADRLIVDIEAVQPLPGQAWPPLPLITAIAENFRVQTRWSELLDRAPTWSRQASRLFLSETAWSAHLRREGTVRMYEAMARSWREGWEILPAALDALRTQCGSHSRKLAQQLLKGARLPEFPPDDDRRRLFEMAAREPLPAPPMPAPWPVWHLDIQNGNLREAMLEARDRDPGLMLWLPTEFRIGSRPDPPGSWSLKLGGDTRKPDGEPLSPGLLVPILRNGRPGRLWAASDAVSAAPEQLGARRFRAALLSERLPCRAVEHLLAEDLRRVMLSNGLLLRDLDADLWFTEAQRAIPPIEEHLQRWPLDGDRWEALAFWTSCLPSHPGPASLATSLPGLRPGSTMLLDLSASIHARVGDELRRQGAWERVVAWFQPTWDALRDDGREGWERRALIRELAAVTQSNLGAAYTALGKTGSRKSLEAEAARLRSETLLP